MCTAQSLNIIWKVVDQKLQRRDMFTAYEVSEEARRNGMAERYGIVKKQVHRMIQNSIASSVGINYERTLIDIDDEKGQAILYYPSECDPAVYIPMTGEVPASIDATAPAGAAIPAGVTMPAGTAIPTGSPAPATTCDKYGRYCIRANVVRDAGFSVGDTVRVEVGTNRIVVSNGISGVPYKVDKDSNVRIAPRRIREAFGGLRHPRLGVEYNRHSIVIKNI